MPVNRIMIIDDEAPARKLLTEYLQHYSQLAVVGYSSNGLAAVEEINQLRPDIIFLDIQMPGKNGFEVIRELKFSPRIIFCTAWDEYAIQAFEVNACDYLLKPYTAARLSKTIAKVLAEPVRESYSFEKSYVDRLIVQIGKESTTINTKEILWIEAFGDYTRIHTGEQAGISNKTMQELENCLDPQLFQRAHRSAIVANMAIRQKRKDAEGIKLYLINGNVIRVSRTYSRFFTALIS